MVPNLSSLVVASTAAAECDLGRCVATMRTCVSIGCDCQDEAVVDGETERRLLENVLDALDDLYDRRDQAERWVERLLLATSVALRGTQWERPMAEAATAIELLRLGDGTYDAKNAAALAATGDLRLEVADAL